jgi:pimeloyl-ACP methyl ester carboxylesterase
MDRMGEALSAAGYRVCNIDYPSRKHPVAELAARHVAPEIGKCIARGEPVHFVTHSLGGIIVRQLAATGAVQRFGRVVMLGPPNQGSEVVDTLGNWGLFGIINGPAGRELGTSPGALPQKLGPATFELGIIAGNRSINPILSTIIPGDDDGKVAIERARLEGMRDFIVVPASHPFLMKNDEVISQTIHFLACGAFEHGTSPKTGPVICAQQR